MPNQKIAPLYIGDTAQQPHQQVVAGEFVSLSGEVFYKIKNYAGMPPFFMSIVSSSNHWLFISSTGGLSAGRVSAEKALFPYYTEDKLAENSENTGSKTILLVSRGGRTSLWEPFSERQQGAYAVERNIYKNVASTAVIFEEINHSLGLSCRYAWRTSDAYGFIRTAWLANQGQSACQVELVDGLQNILPANIASNTQNDFSCLLDAYKRSEVNPQTGLAIFALNSTLTDLAEPSESLLATTVVQVGLEPHGYLLSSAQLQRFRAGLGLLPETEVRGQRCAYFVHAALELAPGAGRTWHLAAEVSQDSAAIVRLARSLADPAALAAALEKDVAANTLNLEKIVASADGLQVSSQKLRSAHHFANVMFNTMRGGIFAGQYQIDSQDFKDFLAVRSRRVLAENSSFFAGLPAELSIFDLQARAAAGGTPDLIRLSSAYLPLSFSRRHGDPSRPWNRFAINIKKADGSRQLDYEGNWRDIFQNWEALAYSYPEYIEGMICTFLNATTADGYNPYRITRKGIDWELPEPNNPWANIGYWSDHQIIYLLKLMEISTRVHPGKLVEFLTRPMFSYANIPYQIKPYEELLQDPYNTIDFNWERQAEIERRVEETGTDGKLAFDRRGQLLQANLVEKLLTLLLAKLVNFVPEGGIWMNTQRPEWNDANNALVGKGISVVTLCYLRRYIVFFRQLLSLGQPGPLELSAEVQQLFARIAGVLAAHQGELGGSFTAEQRRAVMDGLGQAGSDYRWNYYANGFSGAAAPLAAGELVQFLDLALQYVEHSLRANKRSDQLYHAYNILHFEPGQARVSHLYEMLEGQVAILSSGLLSGDESLALLESMRRGPLYRPDQHTYILYPDRQLPGFLEKNCLTPAQVSGLALAAELVRAQDKTLFVQDLDGNFHFSGQIRNLKNVHHALNALRRQPRFAGLVEAETGQVEALFESVFHHNEFTGRSGTFFAYEGLGSVYWHMVSKLLLAVQETILRTRLEPSSPALIEKYAGLCQGLGFNKPADEYGAFPTDPYSHTPKGQGARQPGMTGMVKEEILTRQAELGLFIEDGCLKFDFLLFERAEFLPAAGDFEYWGVDGQLHQLELPPGSLAYSICQVPIILQAADCSALEVHRRDGAIQRIAGGLLDAENTRRIFQRDGTIERLVVFVAPQQP